MDASVLIPVYNGARYIQECLQSVTSSDYSGDFEVIVVNDGSTDATEKMVKRIQTVDPRVKLINQSNLGIETALNNGIQNCTGEIIIRLDADDVMLKDRISSQIEIFKNNPDLDWISGRATIIDWNSRPLVDTWNPPCQELIFKIIHKYSYIIHPTVAIRRRVLIESGGYYRGEKHREDIELWKRLHAAGAKYKFIDKTFIKYRVSDSSVRSNGNYHAERKIIRLLIYYGGKSYVFSYLFLLPLSYWPRFMIMVLLPTKFWTWRLKRYVRK